MSPSIEIPEELAEYMADRAMVYGGCTAVDPVGGRQHGECTECRICFVEDMAQRIREAVANENLPAEQRKTAQKESR